MPAGVTLTSYTGPTTITKAGTVIDGKDITVPLVIAAGADNVTIRNFKIRPRASGWCSTTTVPRTCESSTPRWTGMGNASGDAAVGGYNYTLTRVNIHGTVDGLKLGSNVMVQDSYIHDLVIANDSHNDGMQNMDGANIVIRHNTISWATEPPRRSSCVPGWASSATSPSTPT